MLSDSSKEYIESIKSRIKHIPVNDLDQAFNKFEAYYRIYGRLFNDCAKVLIERGRNYRLGNDQDCATKAVIEYLTTDIIFDAFDKNADDIETLITILPSYRIKFSKKSEYQPEVDEALLTGLQSTDKETKVLSLLQVLYFVRCNIAHSRKVVEDRQILLLNTLTNLLETLNALQIAELSKE